MALNDVVNQNDDKTADDLTEGADAPVSEDPKPTPPEDPDEIELLAAKKAVEEEDAQAKSPPEDQPNSDAKQDGEEAKAPTAETPKAEDAPKPESEAPIMIPKSRFDELNSKLAQTREELAREQGKSQALQMVNKGRSQQSGQPETTNEPPKPTFEQRIGAVRNQRLALAEKFDAGEITSSEFEKERFQLEDQEAAIREEKIQVMVESSKPKEANTPKAVNDDLYLEARTQELETQHPYLHEMSRTDIDYLTVRAVADLQTAGVAIPEDGSPWSNSLRLQVRTKVAELSDKFGPTLTGKTLNTGSPNAQQGAARTPPAPSSTAKDRERKLAMANEAPPNINHAGAPSVSSEKSSEEILNMDDEQLSEYMKSLPEAARQRLEASL